MNLTILDEGVIWKHRDASTKPLIAFKGHSIPLGHGEILHAMQMGTGRFTPDAHCRVTRSRDYGKTWSEPVAPQLSGLAGHAPTSMHFNQEPGVFRALITCDQNVAKDDPRWCKENGGWVGTTQFWCESTNGGHTWATAKPFRLPAAKGGFNVVSSPVFTLQSGDRMVVIEPMISSALAELVHEAAVVFNRNGSDEWGNKRHMAYDPEQRTLFFDPRVARLQDGRFVALYWTHDPKTDTSLRTRIGWSEDGRSWTTPKELPFWGFLSYPLPLADGRLLAVFNHRREPQGVRCVISEDAGRNWDMENEYVLWDQRIRRITGERATESVARKWEGNILAEMGTGFTFGIPYPIQLDDGSVFVSFYATLADGVMHQRYVRVRLE